MCYTFKGLSGKGLVKGEEAQTQEGYRFYRIKFNEAS